jgi:serine/threonine protein kinase
MELLCTRPGCTQPVNDFPELDDARTLKLTREKFCRCCGMPLILGDRYLPVQLLGQGGFGAAYLARDRHTPGMRSCVVKQFKPATQLNHQQHQLAHDLFMREGEVLEELGREHLQIPDLFAFFDLEVPGVMPGTEEAYFYLAQEFIDGEDLEQELRRVGRLDEAAVLEILVSMLKVLGFVHAHQTIHRDIKPSNIMRSRKGRLYLLDFGAIKYATSQASRPQSSTSIFSLGYAPPEQMAGAGVSFSTDLYALAATCVECLTGLPPSQLCHPVTRVYTWRSALPVGNPVSDRLANILDKMLQPTPYDRFATAAEVLAELCPEEVIPHPFEPPISSELPAPAPAPIDQAFTQMPIDPNFTQLPIYPSPPQPLPPQPLPQPLVMPPVTPLQPSTQSSRSARRPFSIVELLSSAAFTGFEGALLAIGLHVLTSSLLLKAVLWCGLAAGLIYLQTNRTIERLDLPIIAAITLGILVLVLKVGFVSSMMVAVAIALVTTLAVLVFRLVYTLLT